MRLGAALGGRGARGGKGWAMVAQSCRVMHRAKIRRQDRFWIGVDHAEARIPNMADLDTSITTNTTENAAVP